MEKAKTAECPVIWIQCATCTGCSVSALNSVSPSIKNVLIDEVIPGKHVNLRFQATVMAGAGDAVIEEMKETSVREKGKYILVVEGAIPTTDKAADYGSIGEENGEPVSMVERVETLGKDALAVVALGTCAAFGGIAAGKPNPAGCISVGDLFKEKGITTPLVNIPGCPPHPDWFIGTIAKVLLIGLPGPKEVDEYGRPKDFYGQLIHENCPRRAYFDEGKFAKKFSDPGCLNELGCKGPVTHADCPLRLWNGGVNWCIGSGSPCIGCVEPGFPDQLAPFYKKLTEDILPNIGSREEV
ncbi:MAG: hydrogenase small subunit [Dehalococcoidales bacterium]|nr:MAG: hydrogenase small subunit [Dehalococcoidales bacterium]